MPERVSKLVSNFNIAIKEIEDTFQTLVGKKREETKKQFNTIFTKLD